jgi:2-iminobutanoate/2-iminopropanoate deaminase
VLFRSGWRAPGRRLWQVREVTFGDNFPGSATVTITALDPDAKIEIQGFAVIGSK